MKHFLLTFIENPSWGFKKKQKKKKAPIGAMMKQSHWLLQQRVGQHWLLSGGQTWYCFLSRLLHPPPAFEF